jgi:hypothetical protein
MPINEAVWSERHIIVPVIHGAIIHGMLATWSECTKLHTLPQEPDFVAGLVLDSCPLIHAALSRIFAMHGIQSSLLGVFCHQTPKVKYAGIHASSCELGDLLIVHVHTSSTGYVRRNAILYQAKVSSNQPYRIPRHETDQLQLYVEWPDFEYHQSPPLSGIRRSVSPKTIHTGAQYMLIDDRPPTHPESGLLDIPGTYPIGSCMPSETLHDHNDLANELLQVLLVRSGRPFADRASACNTTDWSALVWDLLGAAIQKSFNRKRSGRRQKPRVAGGLEDFDGLSFGRSTSSLACSTVTEIVGSNKMTSLFNDNSEHPPNMARDRHNEESSGGISIILLETATRRPNLE